MRYRTGEVSAHCSPSNRRTGLAHRAAHNISSLGVIDCGRIEEKSSRGNILKNFKETNQSHNHADETWLTHSPCQSHSSDYQDLSCQARPRLNHTNCDHLGRSILKHTHPSCELIHLCPDENHFLSTDIHLQRKHDYQPYSDPLPSQA